jgi:hypothetical protein
MQTAGAQATTHLSMTSAQLPSSFWGCVSAWCSASRGAGARQLLSSRGSSKQKAAAAAGLRAPQSDMRAGREDSSREASLVGRVWMPAMPEGGGGATAVGRHALHRRCGAVRR